MSAAQPMQPMFSGQLSYLRLPSSVDYANADLAVVGVPVDAFVSNRAGARFGPRALRQASTMISWDDPFGWGKNPLAQLRLIDAGDCPFDYGKPDEIGDRIQEHFGEILNHQTATLALGGDHYISYPILKAYAKNLGQPLSLVQFDSHSDTWQDENKETRMDHGTMFARAIKEGIIEPTSSVQLGIRTNIADPLDMHIINATEVHTKGIDWAIAKTREIIGDNPTYITFDMDFLDPAYAPATGTPCCGGFSSSTALAAIRQLDSINLVAMDLVELCPPYDHGEITALAAATIASHLLCLFANSKKSRS